jgi:hypothetical protein
MSEYFFTIGRFDRHLRLIPNKYILQISPSNILLNLKHKDKKQILRLLLIFSI